MTTTEYDEIYRELLQKKVDKDYNLLKLYSSLNYLVDGSNNKIKFVYLRASRTKYIQDSWIPVKDFMEKLYNFYQPKILTAMESNHVHVMNSQTNEFVEHFLNEDLSFDPSLEAIQAYHKLVKNNVQSPIVAKFVDPAYRMRDVMKVMTGIEVVLDTAKIAVLYNNVDTKYPLINRIGYLDIRFYDHLLKYAKAVA